jgi:diguanylate cyclase (GGDEF)-like protein/PAS domain S-box-containing protein
MNQPDGGDDSGTARAPIPPGQPYIWQPDGQGSGKGGKRPPELASLLLDSSAEGIIGLDVEDRLTFINPAVARILKLDPAAALGQRAHALFHHSYPDGRPWPASECPLVRAAREQRPVTAAGEVFWRSDGTPLPVDVRVDPLSTDTPTGTVMTFRDVSERIRNEEARAAAAAFQRAVLNSLPGQIAVVDVAGSLVAVNAAWTRFMQERDGTPQACGVGVNFFAVCERAYGPDRVEALEAAAGLRAVLTDGAQFTRDVTCSWKEQELFFSLQIVPLDSSGRGAVLGYTDITERKQLEVEAAHQATHDELTGLPNRTLLLDRLEHALRERDGAPLAVLFVDLDHFKLVNDGYGHEAGDRVLREVARRLCAAVRPADTVARLAGDEFVVLCERLPYVAEAYRLAERILAAVTQPFPVDHSTITLGASVGLAEAEDRTLTPDELLRAADQAMFEAKARGRNQYALFDDGVHRRSRERLEQALALRRLVHDDQLTLHYQPVVDLHDGRITGVEALLRGPGQGQAFDAESTISLAEEIGLVGQIGRWVLRTACRDAVTFRKPDGSVLPLSINLAPEQLDASLAAFVARTTSETGFPIAGLTVELTERTVMANPDAASAVLRELRELGVRVALDDFGIGYSSLARLRDLPLDLLKVDQAFVQALAETPSDDRLVRAIIELAAALGLGVVAEGIEQTDQQRRLLELGCERGQGFLFSPARPANAIRDLVTS